MAVVVTVDEEAWRRCEIHRSCPSAHIKKDFDRVYGGGWQCVVGSNFSSFFTHSEGSFFIYFSLETLNFLIFKGAAY
ncbi:putative dynein ATPase [Helianthus annuus]|nr:putative dynein ATPase [Helianthus annuus]